MGANSLDAALIRTMTNAAQAKLAPQGGYGKGSGLGKFMNFLAPALSAALPNSPLFRGIDSARQAVNTANYNKYIQAQAQQAQMLAAYERQMKEQQNANNAGIYSSATGQQVDNPSAGFDTGFASSMVPNIRRSNQSGNINDYLAGQPLQVDQYGDMDASLIQKYKDRQGAVADTRRKLDFMGETIANALNQQAQAQAKPGEPVMEADPNILKGQIAQNDLATMDPYTTGVLSDSAFSSGINLRGGEQDFKLGTDRNTETTRSNKARESETSRHNKAAEAADMLRAQAAMVSANRPVGGGGGSLNETEAIMGLAQQMGLSPEETMAALQSGNTTAPSEKALEYLDKLERQYNTAGKSSNGFFGMGATQANLAEQAKIARKYNSIAKRYGLPGLGGSTFGGGQAQQLKQTKQQFTTSSGRKVRI